MDGFRGASYNPIGQQDTHQSLEVRSSLFKPKQQTNINLNGRPSFELGGLIIDGRYFVWKVWVLLVGAAWCFCSCFGCCCWGFCYAHVHCTMTTHCEELLLLQRPSKPWPLTMGLPLVLPLMLLCWCCCGCCLVNVPKRPKQDLPDSCGHTRLFNAGLSCSFVCKHII